jgi:hypothetical protein
MRRFSSLLLVTLPALASLNLSAVRAAADSMDLTHAVVVIRGGTLPTAEKIAPVILTEEMAKRTGISWSVTDRWPEGKQAIIALSTTSAPPNWKQHIPAMGDVGQGKPEGFSIRVLPAGGGQPDRVFVTGSDPRGVMFGVGKLLRVLEWGKGTITVPADFSADLAPDRPIRGHQVGYRATANSWDAWTVEQFDQYFRDMVIFGANAVENIPFEGKVSDVMKYGRREMNLKLSALCAKYDLDHWCWVPVDFLLPNPTKAAKFLSQQEEFYKTVPRLDAVFVPGGDPGDNLFKDLLPYVEKMAAVLRKYHPHAKIWISLQRPHPGDDDAFFGFIETKRPNWFGGAVMGPSGPSMEVYRRRLPQPYQLRWYPDITHIVRCQYPIPWLDSAWGVTIGREPVNPRAVDYAAIYHNDYRLTDGFISYSDGIHDDFNKNLWTQLGWEPYRSVREIAAEYARFFFRPDLAQVGADAILALESNLRGSMAENGSVDGTLRQWQQMEQGLVGSPTNWRFDMHLFRAYYDAYTRRRQLYETDLEKQALAMLGEAEKIGVPAALNEARAILERTTTQHPRPDWFKRTEALADLLFHKIGYQTSVVHYHGSGPERGCLMDFVNYPLNNRWWLEDQFDRIAKMTDRTAQLTQIDVIRNWENPGEGGYYDVLGDVGRSPHMLKVFNAGDAMRSFREIPMPTQRWMGQQRRAVRFAWHKYFNRLPSGLTYTALDPGATYTVRLFSQRPTELLVDGKPARLIRTGDTYDEVTEQEFSVPSEAVQDGRIVLNWVNPDERNVNWRQQHYVTDIWLIRHSAKSKSLSQVRGSN